MKEEKENMKIKNIDISNWRTIKGQGYILNDEIKIVKANDYSLEGNSNTYILIVEGKEIMQNGSGYTINYLKKLGSLYKKYGINKKIFYNEALNEIIFR